MGTSRDPSVRVSSSDQFGSTPGGICVKFSTSHILLWHVLGSRSVTSRIKVVS